MSKPLEITLPSRKAFEAALADNQRLDPRERADLERVFESLIEWQVNPRPRYWYARNGGLQFLPMGLSGPLAQTTALFHQVQKHTRPAAVPYSPEESWKSWCEILLPSRTTRT
jgi:hypothetical protein